nr:BLUF domain-containing protein [Paracoccus sp. (in: a-proteobacteria)]
MSEGLEYSLYRSTASRALRAGELEDILAAARARNQAMSLTGCLHYEDGLFFQWLEGPADALREVLGLFLRDGGHRD